MNKQEKREQLISEYTALINLKVSVTERVHNTAAERYGFTFDECVECLQEAIIRCTQSSKQEKMAQLTKRQRISPFTSMVEKEEKKNKK